MIVKCDQCKYYYNDEFRLTYCPHDAFNANDGNNNFKIHYDSYRSIRPPTIEDLNKARQDSL